MSATWMILSVLPAGIFADAATRPSDAPDLPRGYKLVYEQSFDEPGALNDYRFTDPGAWRWRDLKNNHALEQHKTSAYEPPHRSPLNMAVLYTLELESFVLEARLLQTGRDYGHRDMCLFFGFVDPARYYYSHIATATDDHAHNVFIVNEQPRTRISTRTSSGVDWGTDEWHDVRLVRDVEQGTIEVYFDNMAEPIMTATDRSFGRGYIGFGSFDDTGMVDDVRIWAPTVSDKRASSLFAAKPLEPVEKEPDLDSEGFISMFDGRTLTGWQLADGKASGKMEFTAEQETIVGTCVPGQPNGFLRTEKTYGDFIFTCEVRYDVPGNSGIQFRSRQRETDGRVYGYQCEIDPGDRRFSGGIYDEARRAWLFPLWGKAYEEARSAFHVDKWNRFTIQARGHRLQTWVNGIPCADYTDTDAGSFTPSGFIALQVHGGKEGRIRWRNLRIKELNTPILPTQTRPS